MCVCVCVFGAFVSGTLAHHIISVIGSKLAVAFDVDTFGHVKTTGTSIRLHMP